MKKYIFILIIISVVLFCLGYIDFCEKYARAEEESRFVDEGADKAMILWSEEIDEEIDRLKEAIKSDPNRFHFDRTKHSIEALDARISDLEERIKQLEIEVFNMGKFKEANEDVEDEEWN